MMRLPGKQHWGVGLAEGIGEGLETIARHKLGQVIERQGRKRDEEELEQSAGFTPQYARFVASQPKEHRYKYILGAGPEAYKQQQPNQEQFQQQRVQEAQSQAFTPQEQQQVGLQDLIQSLNPRNASQNQLNQLTGGAGNNFLQNLMSQQQQGQQGLTQAQGINPQQAMAPQQAQMAQQVQPAQSAPRTIAGALPKAGGAAKRNIEQEKINTEGRKTLQKYSDKAELAESAINAINIQDALVNSGKMSNPKWAAFIKNNAKKGSDFSSILSEETGKFEALNAEYFPLLPYLISGNPTSEKVKEYAKKLPQITDSPETIRGKLKFLRDRMSHYLEEYKAASDLSQKYDGQFPPDFSVKIKEKIDELGKERKGASPKSAEASEGKTFEKLPSAASLPGKRMKFPDGTIRRSNGSQWVKE